MKCPRMSRTKSKPNSPKRVRFDGRREGLSALSPTSPRPPAGGPMARPTKARALPVPSLTAHPPQPRVAPDSTRCIVMSIVRNKLILLALALASPEQSPARTVAVSSGFPASHIIILKNGIRSPDVSGDETDASCVRFRLTPNGVRLYFKRARRVTEAGYFHDLPMSPCRSSGTLRRTNGTNAAWSVDSARRGWIADRDGPPVYLFCITCAGPHFEPLDAEDRAIARSVIVP